MNELFHLNEMMPQHKYSSVCLVASFIGHYSVLFAKLVFSLFVDSVLNENFSSKTPKIIRCELPFSMANNLFVFKYLHELLASLS